MHIEFDKTESDFLLFALEERMHAIAKTYSGGAQDFEISALMRMAKQLGGVFELKQQGNGYVIVKH